jgi:hypothetical protein
VQLFFNTACNPEGLSKGLEVEQDRLVSIIYKGFDNLGCCCSYAETDLMNKLPIISTLNGSLWVAWERTDIQCVARRLYMSNHQYWTQSDQGG